MLQRRLRIVIGRDGILAIKYPPFCTGTASSVRSVRGAQNSIFCRRHPGECAAKFSRPKLSRPVPRGIRAVCGTTVSPCSRYRPPSSDSELASPAHDQHDRTAVTSSCRELRGCDRLATRSPDRVLLGEGCAGPPGGAAQGEEAPDASPRPAPKALVNPSRSATVTVSAEWPLRRSGDGTFSANWSRWPARCCLKARSAGSGTHHQEGK